MTIRVPCSCGKSAVYPDAYEGRTLACRACKALLLIEGERMQAPRPRRARILLPILLLILVPVGIVAGLIRSRQPRFTSAAEEYKDGSKAPVDPKVDGPRIERLFAALASASKDGNETGFAGCFHTRRMLAEIELRGALQTVTRKRDEHSLESELDATMRDVCDQLKNSLAAWQSVQRCSIKFLEGRGEAEASVVMRAADHLDRYRFWLVKENDAWGIFDYQSLNTGFRMSTHNGKLLVRQAKGELSGHAMERMSGLLDKAQNLLAREKFDQALETLVEAERWAGESGQTAALELTRAEIFFHLNRQDEALAKVDESLKLQKDDPPAVQIRGLILHALKRYDDAIRAQRDYMDFVGEDATAHLWIGMAYEALGKREAALEAYRKGAACDEFDSENRKQIQRLEQTGK